ncbi:MAG: hypothetical protein ACOC1V_01455 [Candidatus Saliniplasma sp.]
MVSIKKDKSTSPSKKKREKYEKKLSKHQDKIINFKIKMDDAIRKGNENKTYKIQDKISNQERKIKDINVKISEIS